MAEPFSIIAGVVGVTDVCIRLLDFLKQAKDGFQKIDTDLEELSKDVASLQSTGELIKHTFETEPIAPKDRDAQRILQNHWQTTQDILEASQRILERLKDLIVNVLGGGQKPTHVKFQSLRKFLRQQSKEKEFTDLRQKLREHLGALQTSLEVVNVIYARETKSTMHDSFSDISKKIEGLGADLQSKLLALQSNMDLSAKTHSFATIARIGRVDPNERAAKNWLSNLGRGQPWLLIIDNTEELSSPVDELFPDSQSGVILLTTRNPTLKMYGTAGPRYYQFAELGEDEAVELLLRAANEPLPWSQRTMDAAKNVCRTLGYLPLALMHAGKTILARLCTLQNYLGFFKKNWDRIRSKKNSADSRALTDANAAIYSSYEIIQDALAFKRTQAADDALDLLRIFSFLHRQRIRVDILTCAAVNPPLEAQRQKEALEKENQTTPHSKSSEPLGQAFKRLGFKMLAMLLDLTQRSVLPGMLRDATDSEYFELRLRHALEELYRFSLIFDNPTKNDDSYSMHPAVHLWVREQPEMTLGDQAVWCQMAATILSQAVLLPPLGGDTEYDEIFRRDLLPHVIHVQSVERMVGARISENQKFRKRVWPDLKPRLNRALAMQLVKFSLVYLQSGLFEEAEKLQLRVLEFCMQMLGPEHASTMDVMLLLSRTYQLTRGDEAAKLQQQVLETCIKIRGPDNLKTLKVMDTLGSSRWQQGRVREAREIHEKAVDGLKRLLGDDNVDTLRAMDNLGRAVGKDFEFTKAIEIHSTVVSGLREKLGRYHLDTLTATDNLAMAYFDRAAYGYGARNDLDVAVDLEQGVWEQRREKLGKENLYSLWSNLNLGRIRALRGEIDEAQAIVLPGLEIAKRNLGEAHFGVLLAKSHYGRMLTYARRYDDAENVLQEVVDSYDGPRKGHPDRVPSLMSLYKCRILLGKYEGTDELAQELIGIVKSVFGENHGWVKYAIKVTETPQDPDEEPITPTKTLTHGRFTSGDTEDSSPAARLARFGHIRLPGSN
ncbi:MAG: hypothetical protein M1831_006728 [Alyxoria varia]|nr:MAG: hypothetical protein M1831_006728 [Alyxoria varia]